MNSQNRRHKVLITNDDGIHSPGIKAVWEALKDVADVFVVAPSIDQSAVALSITVRQPLHIEKINWGVESQVWSVTGTPADCVKLALSALLKEKPDLVISGINRGSNLGRNVLYSGTVAGAIEGVLHNIPGVAVSCLDYHTPPDYAQAAGYIPTFISHLMAHPLPAGTFLNVNFPERRLGKIAGVKMTAQSSECWVEDPDIRAHPVEARSYYWLGSRLHQDTEEGDTDSTWIRKGYVTAVPVHIGNLTDWNHLDGFKGHFERSFDRHSSG